MVATKNRTFSLQRSAPSPALAKWKEKAENANKSLSNFRKKVSESRIPTALMGVGATLSGAALSGAISGAMGDEIAGIPVDVGLALVLGTAGITLDQPLLLHAGSGALAPYIHDWVADKVEDWMDGDKDDDDEE